MPHDVASLVDLIEPLLIASLRVMTVVTIAPLFSRALFPGLLRNMIVLSLSLALYPHVAAHMPTLQLAPTEWIVLIGKEVFIGGLIGLSISLLFRAFESVGALIDLQTGLSNGLLYDPFGGHEEGPMSTFMGRLAVTFFVVGGGLHVMVSLLFESFRVWPVASFLPVIDLRLAQFTTVEFGDLAQWIVRLATPAILVLAVVDIGFGLVNRVVPQLNVFFFTMPIKGVLSALMIALFLSYAADVVHDRVGRLSTLIERLVPVIGTPR